jgi:hypothetical protein
MLITQYGISARAVSEEINADHASPFHGHVCGMGDIDLTRACCEVVGQPVDPQIIRGKFGKVENIRMKPKHFFVCGFDVFTESAFE